MADIESVTLLETIRVVPGANGAHESCIDPRRDSQKGIALKEGAHGIEVYRGGALFTLVPWVHVRQVFYAQATVKR